MIIGILFQNAIKTTESDLRGVEAKEKREV